MGQVGLYLKNIFLFLSLGLYNHVSLHSCFHSEVKAQDTLSPDCRRKKNRAHHKYKKEYSDDGLFGYTVSSLKAARHRYILFVFMESSVFSDCSPSLVYLGPKSL